MPMEFRQGRTLSPEELEIIRQQIEEGYEISRKSMPISAVSSPKLAAPVVQASAEED
jgi:hypothetical protein